MEDIQISVNIQLEPEAQEFVKATANPPYLFDLGPDKGRAAVDEVQSGPVSNFPVEMRIERSREVPAARCPSGFCGRKTRPPSSPLSCTFMERGGCSAMRTRMTD